MSVYWAHVDSEGRLISWGQCSTADVFLQHLPDGLTAVARPPEVTGYGGWRYINGEWVQTD